MLGDRSNLCVSCVHKVSLSTNPPNKPQPSKFFSFRQALTNVTSPPGRFHHSLQTLFEWSYRTKKSQNYTLTGCLPYTGQDHLKLNPQSHISFDKVSLTNNTACPYNICGRNSLGSSRALFFHPSFLRCRTKGCPPAERGTGWYCSVR